MALMLLQQVMQTEQARKFVWIIREKGCFHHWVKVAFLLFVRAKPCLPLWSFSLIRKTELLVAFNITSGIEVSFFSAKSRTLLIYRYQKKEDTLRNLYEKKKEKLISYICFLASLGLKVTILFSVILNFLIFPVSESLNLYSNSSTHSLMRYKSIKQLKTKIQEDIY